MNAKTDIPQADPVDRADMAFLFEENGGTRRAITRDVMGAKLPDAPRGWSVTSTFLLAVDQVMPVDVNPEPVIRAILADGVYCWDTAQISQPKSTGE